MDGAAVLAKNLGGTAHKIGKSATEIELPKQAFAMLPISVVLESVTNKLGGLLNGTRRHRTTGPRMISAEIRVGCSRMYMVGGTLLEISLVIIWNDPWSHFVASY